MTVLLSFLLMSNNATMLIFYNYITLVSCSSQEHKMFLLNFHKPEFKNNCLGFEAIHILILPNV